MYSYFDGPIGTGSIRGVPLGSGEPSALRYYLPCRATGSPTPQTAVTYPLAFRRFHEDPSFANWVHVDWVYIVGEHPPRPTSFQAVVGWDWRRGADRSNLEGPTRRE